MQHSYKTTLEHKLIYLILCWAFGYFGVHRFYEKKIFSGIVYLLTFGFFGIGVTIDFVICLISIVKCVLSHSDLN